MQHHQFHLTYCTNIHPGETWAEVWINLQQYLPLLKRSLSPHQPFGIGLRLADVASRELLQGDRLSQFKAWLAAEGLYVFTLNGFPYGSFHHQVIKDQVYAPDWTTSDRIEYTRRLIKILSELLPEGIEGSISTLPLSYKPWFLDQPEKREKTYQSSALALAQLTSELLHLHAETGQIIHLGLEPEPDGLLENTQDVINFFDRWLRPLGSTILQQQLQISTDQALQSLHQHVRICYDTCHFAVAYEEPAIALYQLQEAGIKISKIQLSSALSIPIPDELAEREAIAHRLSGFSESTYLHQVIARHSDGTLTHYPDLEQALPEFLVTSATEWRVHFHVPIFLQNYSLLQSTQQHLTDTLQYVRSHSTCHHLEIETYTWSVLPDTKADLSTFIQQEYHWVLQQ